MQVKNIYTHLRRRRRKRKRKRKRRRYKSDERERTAWDLNAFAGEENGRKPN